MIRAGQREEVLPVIGEIEKEYQKSYRTDPEIGLNWIIRRQR